MPELGGKFQAVPGYHNYTWFKIDKPGVFRGQCAFLCGRGHARMIATVRAVPPAAVRSMARQPEAAIAEANAAATQAREKLGSQTGAAAVKPRSRKPLASTARPSAPDGHLRSPRPARDRAPRRARAHRLDELDHDDRSQADRDHVHGHDLRLLPARRRRGADDPPAAGRAGKHAGHAADLQPAVHDARHDDGLPVRRADHGGPGELLRAADDRRARHGLPAPERPLLLAAAGGRDRLLRVGLLEPAGSRLGELRAARQLRPSRPAAARTPGST